MLVDREIGFDIGIVEVISPPDRNKLIDTLRNVSLKGDPSVHPYEKAEINITAVRIDELLPTSLYVNTDELMKVNNISEQLSRRYRLHPLFLQGMATYYIDGRQHVMSPPIVEKSEEGSLIVDGLHRLYLGRQNSFEWAFVTEITNVDPRYPLVPLPVTWNDVKEVDATPAEKRHYRFRTVADLASRGYFVPEGITDHEVKYYNYRDLSALGSSGIRPVSNFSSINGQSHRR